MIPLFLGLTLANFLTLGFAFAMGFSAYEGAQPGDGYGLHIAMGMIAGLVSALCHCAVFTYFMATTKWLQAATDKAGLDRQRFVASPIARKRRAFMVAMAAIGVTMITAFGGAATDTIAWWPDHLHITLATLALLGNAVCAVLEYKLIRGQQGNMDAALAVLNDMPGVEVRHA